MIGPAGMVPIKLNLGSGREPLHGWVNLDLNPNAPDVDIVGPAFPLDLPDACCEEIRAVDVLEHISYRLTDAVLREWARVLIPEGKLFVQVPDADEIMRWYSEESWWLVQRIPPELPQTALMGACWRLFGGQEDGVQAHSPGEADFNLHRAMFSHESLTEALSAAGFRVLSCETNAHPNLCYRAVKR